MTRPPAPTRILCVLLWAVALVCQVTIPDAHADADGHPRALAASAPDSRLSAAGQDTAGAILMRWKDSDLPNEVFIRQYVRFVSTAPVRDDSTMRLETAHELLAGRILADRAAAMGLDRDPSIRTEIERSRKITMARMLVRANAEAAVGEPGEEDIRAAFRRFHTQMELSQIFAQDQDAIMRHAESLRRGASFDSLAGESMLAVGEPASTAYMGWVRWNQMGLGPERAAFSLQPDSISDPVRSAAGWHIFKAINRRETFFADRSTYQQSRESLKTALIRREISEWSEAHVDSVMSEQRIRIFAAPLRDLWTVVQAHHPGMNGMDIQGPPSLFMSDAQLTLPAALGPDTAVAELNGRPITAGMVVERLPFIPSAVIRLGMQAAMDMILVDEMMSETAASEGFDEHPEVKLTTMLAATSALQRRLLRSVADTLTLEHHAERFAASFSADLTGRQEERIAWNAVSPEVREEILARMEANRSVIARRLLLDSVGYRRGDVIVDTAAVMSALPFGLEP